MLSSAWSIGRVELGFQFGGTYWVQGCTRLRNANRWPKKWVLIHTAVKARLSALQSQPAARIAVRMPALTAAGSVGQASTTVAKSRSVGRTGEPPEYAVCAPTAPDSAPLLLAIVAFSDDFALSSSPSAATRYDCSVSQAILEPGNTGAFGGRFFVISGLRRDWRGDARASSNLRCATPCFWCRDVPVKAKSKRH
jgi:hypothetical protein